MTDTRPGRISKLLIANRGEIALRIARSAAEAGLASCAVAPEDDRASGHARRAVELLALPGQGAAAYLDGAAVIAAGRAAGCDAVHPGYGFLSESAEFARAAEAAGLRFVGPTPEALALYGDKLSARALAQAEGVPVLPGSEGAVDAAGARAFWDGLPDGAGMILKAVAGGGGRGMRIITTPDEIEAALAAASREAEAAFGNGAIYAERFVPEARHIEVQIIGDGTGAVEVLGERDCTLQRRHQKLIEIAPAPNLSERVRAALWNHAARMARAGSYRSLGTFEFLLDTRTDEVFFIEANPRLQVEHTITEEVYGLDLVALQLRLAEGATLADLALQPVPRGTAIEARVTLERLEADGQMRPSGGTLGAYEPPSGPGLRIDGCAYPGAPASSAYDPLLAKVIAHAGDFAGARARLERGLAEFAITGVETNLGLLRALLARPEMARYTVTTRFIEEQGAALAKAAGALQIAQPLQRAEPAAEATPETADLPAGDTAVPAPMQATVVAVEVAAGDVVAEGQPLAVLEAMKMEHVVTAPLSGTISVVSAGSGATLSEGALLCAITPGAGPDVAEEADEEIDLDAIRPDLRDLLDRQAKGQDAARPEAVARRHAKGQRTVRENLASLVDEGSFNEYGELAIAAQSRRRSREDLETNTSGDGILTGTGTVNGALFGAEGARTAVALGDYTVLAGTQGYRHHRKLDRIFGLAGTHKLPLVFFAEGGGGRPGDIDHATVAGLDSTSFAAMARLSGEVPLVGVAAGRCFAGNAALLGCCDVIIATEDSSIGMAGPAMIEGGGLGRYAAEEVGPIAVQSANGVVDLRVADEAAACAAVRQYLSYFQGDLAEWTAPDPRLLRRVIPENRLRSYDMRAVIAALADDGSVMELRRDWAAGMITSLVRIEGRAYGLIANNPTHLGGAVDAPAADKAARFMQLCDAHGVPLLSLCDTPGFMVGPEAEKTALVRHVSRLFVTGAALSVPLYGIVLRKGYGLGAMAMLGGSFHAAALSAAWPTGEFGGMGLEGAVHLGFRKELEALTDPAEKQALFDKLLARLYDEGRATHYAAATEIDAVIDPAETRRWIANARNAAPVSPARQRRGFIDTW